MIASAPGKLIVTGEYAVLDGAAALVIAVDRRAVARHAAAATAPRSPFLVAVAAALAAELGADHPAVAAARAIVVDSSAFYAGEHKLGLGSSAAVTVAATALALGADDAPLDRARVLRVALAAHASAQGARGARGSGADIAAIVAGGTIEFRATPTPTTIARRWPPGVVLVPFFTGASADTATLVARIAAARVARPAAVAAALVAIADASDDACAACSDTALAAAAHRALATGPNAGPAADLLAALAAAAAAIDALAAAAEVELVPACVTAARRALAPLGGVVKTTGAGGGDVGIAAIPITIEEAIVRARLIACGCQPLALSVDHTGVDLRAAAQ